MRYVSRALLAGGLGLAAAFLTACGGGSNVLDASQNSSLSALLSQAHQDNANGDCADADDDIDHDDTDDDHNDHEPDHDHADDDEHACNHHADSGYNLYGHQRRCRPPGSGDRGRR